MSTSNSNNNIAQQFQVLTAMMMDEIRRDRDEMEVLKDALTTQTQGVYFADSSAFRRALFVHNQRLASTASGLWRNAAGDGRIARARAPRGGARCAVCDEAVAAGARMYTMVSTLFVRKQCTLVSSTMLPWCLPEQALLCRCCTSALLRGELGDDDSAIATEALAHERARRSRWLRPVRKTRARHDFKVFDVVFQCKHAKVVAAAAMKTEE